MQSNFCQKKMIRSTQIRNVTTRKTPSRRASAKALETIRSPNPLSPKKGVVRNVRGLNGFPCKRQREISLRSRLIPATPVTKLQKPRRFVKTVPSFRRVITSHHCACCRRVNQRKCWRRVKSVMRPERHEKRREIMEERARKDRLIQIADYNSQLDQLERKYKLHSNDDISCQTSIVFAVICKIIKAIEENECFTLMEICNIVVQRRIRKPCVRYVYNMYTSWRLTRSFTSFIAAERIKIFSGSSPISNVRY